MKKVKVLLIGLVLMTALASFGNAANTFLWSSFSGGGALAGGLGYAVTDQLFVDFSANKVGDANVTYYADIFYGPYGVGLTQDTVNKTYSLMYNLSKSLNADASIYINVAVVSLSSAEDAKPDFFNSFSTGVMLPLF